ncbi:AAA family ATPase [Achromobacter kerstersii]
MKIQKNGRPVSKFKTFLANGMQPWDEQPCSSVVLSPRNPSWNDFGNQVLADIRIKVSESEKLELIGFVIPLSGDAVPRAKTSFYSWVVDLEKRATSPLIPENLHASEFLTLLDDDETYRKLALWAGSLEIRLGILEATKDINLARVSSGSSDVINKIIQEDTFALGVMRYNSAYRAFAKGARFVLREVQPSINDARLDINVHCQLKGFDESHVAKFIFAGKPKLVSDRVQVLIGKNGTGKSQFLNQMIGSLALHADGSGAEVFEDLPNDQFSATAADWQAVPNSVLVFSTDDQNLFPRKARFDAALDYWYFSLASKGDQAQLLHQEPQALGRALRDLIRDESELLGQRRFEIFRDIMNPVLPLSLIHLPLKKIPKKVSGCFHDLGGLVWMPLEKVPSSEQALLYLAAAIDTSRDLALIDEGREIFPPSSGQRVYLRFATLALSVISQGSMIIFDEPETHLHPNFISEFMKLLHDLLTATNSIAVVATHSPYVVREVPTVCVHVVAREGNAPTVGSVHLKTLGASISSISDAVFGDAAATKFHRIVAEKLSKEGKKISDDKAKRVNWLLKNFGDELNAEMLSTIRFLMERNVNDEEAVDDDA